MSPERSLRPCPSLPRVRSSETTPCGEPNGLRQRTFRELRKSRSKTASVSGTRSSSLRPSRAVRHAFFQKT